MNPSFFLPNVSALATPLSNKSAGKQHKIMLVDQDLYVATILKKVLSPEYELIALSNGMEAMSWLEKGNKPDMIISEMNVPHLDGGQLLQLIRNSQFFRDLPFMILSSQQDSSTRIDCLDNGADGYLLKPFNPMEVKAKANAIFRRISYYR